MAWDLHTPWPGVCNTMELRNTMDNTVMMSQDLFADEDGGDCLGTPVEFSGISGSGTSSSPASQPIQPPRHAAPATPGATRAFRPPPPPPPPSPQTVSSSPQLFTCLVCKKVLKTLRGFKGHKDRHSNYPSDEAQVASSSPAVVASASVVTPSPAASTSTEVESLTCPICKATLKTRRGFLKHQASHKLKDAFQRMPDASKFKEEALHSIMQEILEEMLSEPTYETLSPKISFLQKVLEAKESEQWLGFVAELTNFISGLVFEKQTKILPANQFEEMQKKLNTYLNCNDNKLKEMILSVCSEPINHSLAGRLVFRIASKFLNKTQLWAIKNMRSSSLSSSDGNVRVQEMSEIEEKSFLVEMGNMLRAFYQRGIKSSSSEQWQKQSDCIKETFVGGQHPISRNQFLDASNWFSGEELCIVLSHHASCFFKIIELEIMSDFYSSSLQEVVEKVLENRELLDHWYYLTNSYFNEENSLLFLRELIGVYQKQTLHHEEKRKNRLEEKSVRASTVALRTHLQHNFIEKDEDNIFLEEDEDNI
ncbi:Membrane protein insertase YidC [Frankliniella fusca]|uniref:Membrane protein insertase YidC n=1 Tax=Frankliniella fusca TaxID=407009 RepID=A0AAE1LB40_9NEOP|nr:Membrane protein insertase YidC [Frankliniella fusca]